MAGAGRDCVHGSTGPKEMSQAPLQLHAQEHLLQEVPASGVSSEWKKTCYHVILEALSTDALHAKPNQSICFLRRSLCTVVQGMKGEKTGQAG